MFPSSLYTGTTTERVLALFISRPFFDPLIPMRFPVASQRMENRCRTQRSQKAIGIRRAELKAVGTSRRSTARGRTIWHHAKAQPQKCHEEQPDDRNDQACTKGPIDVPQL